MARHTQCKKKTHTHSTTGTAWLGSLHPLATLTKRTVQYGTIIYFNALFTATFNLLYNLHIDTLKASSMSH